MSQEPYDPNSQNAMFSRILANQERDREERAEFRADMTSRLERIGERQDRDGERIGSLETFRTALKSKVGVISGAVALLGSAFFEWVKIHFIEPK